MAGFSQGGGVGLTLAQWMIDGEPERDVFALDVARFGSWTTPGYTLPKVSSVFYCRWRYGGFTKAIRLGCDIGFAAYCWEVAPSFMPIPSWLQK